MAVTPWEYLDNLVSMDRGPEHDSKWMTRRMKERWPGNYVVEKHPCTRIPGYYRYYMVFADPNEEMLFMLRWV